MKNFSEKDFTDGKKVEMILNGKRIDNNTDELSIYFQLEVLVKWSSEQFYIRIDKEKHLLFKKNQISNFKFDIDGIRFTGFDEFNNITFEIELS